MSYKWKPSKASRRAFAERMNNDSDYAAEYYGRKEAKAEKRRATSDFDYDSAGGQYIPTKAQHDFCMENMHLFNTVDEQAAANEVMGGYACQDKVHHDCIHIVNEKMRSNN